MWWKKSDAPEFDRTIVVPPIPEEISCLYCKHRVLKLDAKQVVGEGWYCPKHKPEYDRVYQNSTFFSYNGERAPQNYFDKRYYKTIPNHEVEIFLDKKEKKNDVPTKKKRS